MYWIDQGSYTNQRSFYCDNESDIANLPKMDTEGVKQGDDDVSYLPCAKGSSCLCLGNSSLYILGSNNVWVRV